MHAWQELGLLGEDPTLQFVNTVDDAGKTRATSGIPDWPTLLLWATAAGVVEHAEADALEPLTDSRAADTEIRLVHELREATWSVLHAKAAGEHDAQALAEISSAARQAFQQAELWCNGTGYDWQASADSRDPAIVRARLALWVERFLRGPELARLRECGRCAALFLDHGRGRGRRWCRMETCGNRTKAQRFRARS